MKLLASYNDKVASVVQENAHLNATYTSPDIQKEILYIFSNKVKKEIPLKEGIFFVLSQHNLAISNIRGQGYDGASNMRGEWNGLQALICNELPYAYYIHCLAHRLQLALVAASREVSQVHQFFFVMVFIINIVTASCKCNDELKEAQSVELATKIANDEIESGTGLNQIGILNLLKMFNATCVILSKIAKEKVSYSQHGDADFACNQLLSFEFVFILHLMKEILEITRILSVALQRQSQDILNDMHIVASTKRLLESFRDSGWDSFLMKLQELNSRFNEHLVELVVLSTAFDPRDGFKLFKIDDICNLAEKYYPDDFSEQEVVRLRIELQHSTTERAFSIMKIIKIKLRNKMEDSFLNDCLIVCIEKEIATKFSTESIIDEFASIKNRQAQLTYKNNN
ncbi:uncharacterized protein LOC133826804 [Humulus lupulus]|uniref:uncharacterized protein LOC133826804 n=1 Tax=Humulus lupulus TaxID=3486 RepID=UPI002B40BA33|nr:uncharacterized protein LOC133826804 [Humulus lupulus]